MDILNHMSGYFRYNLFGLLYLTAAFFNISVGLIVLLKNRSNPTNRSFFYVTGAAFIWTLSIGMMDLTADIEKARFWLSSQYFFGVPFISPTVYLFSSRWTKKINKPLIRLGFLFAFLAMVLYSFFPDTVWIIKDRPWGRYPSYVLTPYGKTCVTFLISYFFAYAFLALANFYQGWTRSKNPKERAQFRNILFGFIIAYTGSFDFVAAFDINVFPFGFVSLSVFIAVVAYTMLRHEFLDINLILKRGFMIVLIYSSLFAVILPAAIPLALKFSHNPPKNFIAAILGFGLAVGIILSFGPIIYAYLIRHSYWLRGNISMGITHELKSPLGIIQSAADIILDNLQRPDGDKQKVIEYMQMIQRNAERLDGFVKSLLDVAKTEEGTVTLLRAPFDLVELIRTTVESCKPVADQKSLEIKFEHRGTMGIDGDREKIHQVISNLLSNALKFSKEGIISVGIKRSEKHVIVSVADQGKGISKQHMEQVFNRFYQVDRSQKGAGIGLSIAKAWVEAHGGKIWAESEGAGKGTTVTFTLPV